ncbi:MAG TPA: hypothetical protein VHK46_02225 [Gaiellaceae bacterium]|jgi:uncharacterized ion transporter superfamily protein YfcC|nr:hypothetical protein [Gaiellaceae bacterium]
MDGNPVETESAETPPASEPPAEQPAEEAEEPKQKWFPSAFTVITIVLVGVWLLTFIVPAGSYDVDDEGAPIPGTYEEIEAPLSFSDRVKDLFFAPINGLYGIEDSETGFVDPDASGLLYGSAGVFLFVLAIGMFITVMFATGALDRGIARLAYAVRNRGWLLIVAIMAVFSLLGTVEGFAEETLGFYGLVIPLMLALGYDRMVAVGVIIVGAGVGVMGSTVNPFSIGIASGFADVSIGDGIQLRVAMWITFTVVAMIYVLRYARKVKEHPEASYVGFAPGDREQAVAATATEPEPMTRRHKFVLAAIVLTFAFMIFSIIPWSQIFEGSDAEPYSWELGWWFPELTALFLVSAIVLGVIGGLGESSLTQTMTRGAGDFIYPALVIVLARGVSVVMNNNQITDTVLHAMEGAVDGLSSTAFTIAIFLVNIPMAFLIPSTSGHATLAMPILAPLADFAGVERSLVVTAWNSASGWINLITPTSAVVMGGLALAKVGYNRYIRFVAPLLGILFVLTIGFLALGAALE